MLILATIVVPIFVDNDQDKDYDNDCAAGGPAGSPRPTWAGNQVTKLHAKGQFCACPENGWMRYSIHP